MSINAIINGDVVSVIDVFRSGSSAYVFYINASGALVSTTLPTTSSTDPSIVISTSAVYVPSAANANTTYPSLSASMAVFTDSSKRLQSVPVTGNGSNVLQNVPTISAANLIGTTTATVLILGGQNVSITSGSFPITLTGVSAVTSADAFYAVNGFGVELYIPTLLGVSNTSAATLTGIPVSIRPVRNQTFGLDGVTNVALNYLGAGVLNTSGVITMSYRNSLTVAPLTVFNNTGTKGVTVQTISYLLN